MLTDEPGPPTPFQLDVRRWRAAERFERSMEILSLGWLWRSDDQPPVASVCPVCARGFDGAAGVAIHMGKAHKP